MFTQVSIYRTRPEGALVHDEAARRAQDAFTRTPGFLGRLLGRNVDDPGEYVEAVQWASVEAARAGFTTLAQDETVRAWIATLDDANVRMRGMRTNGAVSRAEQAFADAAVGTWLLVRWQTLPGVDPRAHMRNGLLMHHEVFAPAEGYLGAVVYEAVEGQERMELIGWRDLAIARLRVGEILGAGHELVAHHLADCAEGSSLHYLEPILRA